MARPKAASRSEFDEGFTVGCENTAVEALYLVQAHLDRLDPSQKKMREALINLGVSMRVNLLTRKNIDANDKVPPVFRV